jgi:hypothetical protein
MNLATRSPEDLVDLTFALGMQPCMGTIAANLIGIPDTVRGGAHLPPTVRLGFEAEIRRRGISVATWMKANPARVMDFATRETRPPYFSALQQLGLPLN